MSMIKVAKKQFRHLAIERKIDLSDENRTIDISFSSEEPYERWYGNEILSHADGAMKLERLNNGAPLLFNHDMDKQIGVVEKAWIGPDKRGYATIRFSKSPLGDEKMKDAKDGILKNVSFGYMINEMILSRQGKDGEPSDYTVTDYMPYEISMVTVPADNSVGMGRDLDSQENIEINSQPGSKPANEGVRTMEPTPVDVKVVQSEAARAERERITEITRIGEKFGQQEICRQMIDAGKSVDEVRAAVMEKMGSNQKPITGNEGLIGITDKEIRQYSFLKAMNALANPTDRKAQEAAKFERELSEAAAIKAGKTARGLIVPVDILRASQRDLVVGTPTAGGNIVATDLQADSFIELLRKKSVLQRSGATVLNGLVGNIAIPRQSGAATAYWIGESGSPTESQQTIDQVTMSPKTVGAFTDISRKLLLQSSIDVENMVKGDIATVLALAIDNSGLYGTGSSNQPQGLKFATGLNTKDFAAATPTFAEVVELETLIASDNADVAGMKYLVNAAMRGALKTKEKASGYPVYVMGEDGRMNGFASEMSNQIEDGDIWFGNWADLIMGFWSGLDLMVDPYTGSTSGTVRIVAHQDVDIAARHGESFTRGNNTL